MIPTDELPLRYKTPPEWAQMALGDLVGLLGDHAHLEKKAASNALELLNRWQGVEPPKRWVSILANIARDEAVHLAQVTRILFRMGKTIPKTHHNTYAAGLRTFVRLGKGPEELVDRLLAAALIEARSCERFVLLANALNEQKEGQKDNESLAHFYRGLWASEHGHYRVFVKLAQRVLPKSRVEARWGEWLDHEAQVIQAQPPGARMHSGLPRNIPAEV